MKASPDAQQRLLDLTDTDAELGRLEHARRTLPEHAELAGLDQRDAELRDTIAAVGARAGDAQRELGKAEADVEQVRSRIDRDRSRLDSGLVSSPRDLENLQSEITSLLRRRDALEEIVLGVMERQESAETELATATAEREQSGAARQEVAARRDTALADLGEQEGKAAAQRTAVAADIPADLLDLYEKLRPQHRGVGAAALRRGRCEGCHLSLNTVDLNAIRAAPADEVLRCEECRRILVRTPESGL